MEKLSIGLKIISSLELHASIANRTMTILAFLMELLTLDSSFILKLYYP